MWAGGRASPSTCVGWVLLASLHAGAGIEMCWHPGAATGDAVRCSLCPRGPPPTSCVPPGVLYSVCRCPHLPLLYPSGVPYPPLPQLQESFSSMAGAKKRSWWFGWRWPSSCRWSLPKVWPKASEDAWCGCQLLIVAPSHGS